MRICKKECIYSNHDGEEEVGGGGGGEGDESYCISLCVTDWEGIQVRKLTVP